MKIVLIKGAHAEAALCGGPITMPALLVYSRGVLGDVHILADEQKTGSFEPWFSLFCHMAVKLEAMEPVNEAV